MKPIILHIPHSSTYIPTFEGYVLPNEAIEEEILKLTDWYTDDLFDSPTDILVKADFSRVFCDAERFADDSQEIMAKYGMGVLYEKTDDGKTLRQVNPDLRKRILKEYYWLHHQKLGLEVQKQLLKWGQSLIIDCHSFPSIPLNRDLNKELNRPDFNIGTDPYHTPQILIDRATTFFSAKGYSLGIDWPYRGSIVPMEYYQNNKMVSSIMLEINRKLYLKEPTNEKSENYPEMKRVVNEFLKVIRQC